MKITVNQLNRTLQLRDWSRLLVFKKIVFICRSNKSTFATYVFVIWKNNLLCSFLYHLSIFPCYCQDLVVLSAYELELFCFILFVCGARDPIQGLTHTRHLLYYTCYVPSPCRDFRSSLSPSSSNPPIWKADWAARCRCCLPAFLDCTGFMC